jgi:hypothetical protein
MLGTQFDRNVNVTELASQLPETENAELPSGTTIAGSLLQEDEGIPQTKKEKNDYRGKKDAFTGHLRQNHPFDRKSGTGK